MIKVIRHLSFYIIIFFSIISMGRCRAYAQTFPEERKVVTAYDAETKVVEFENDEEFNKLVLALLTDISGSAVSRNEYDVEVLRCLKDICICLSENRTDRQELIRLVSECNVERSVSLEKVSECSIGLSGQDILELKDFLKSVSNNQSAGRTVEYTNGIVLVMMLGCMVAFVITRYLPWKH